MRFQIIWSDSAAKELKKLDRTISKRIFNKVSQLSENPYHFDVIKLHYNVIPSAAKATYKYSQ